MRSVESDCHILSRSLPKFNTWLLSVLVFMAGEADNGKTIRSIVKLPVSGCKISVKNKFLMQLPALSASLAKKLAICMWMES